MGAGGGLDGAKHLCRDGRASPGAGAREQPGAGLGSGKIVAQKLTPTKSGFNVQFVRPEVLEVKPGKDSKVHQAVKEATAEVTDWCSWVSWAVTVKKPCRCCKRKR